LIIVDEDGYFPFEQDAANLLFQFGVEPLRACLTDSDIKSAVRPVG